MLAHSARVMHNGINQGKVWTVTNRCPYNTGILTPSVQHFIDTFCHLMHVYVNGWFKGKGKCTRKYAVPKGTNPHNYGSP